MVTAALLVDSQCTLGEGIVWDGRRDALLWTDIERATLWLHHTDDGSTRTWRLPDRLGSLALCDSGKLLLALANGLFPSAEVFHAAGGFTLAPLEELVLAVEQALAVADASLLALNLLAPSANLDLPLFSKSDQLLLAGEDSGLAEAFRLSLGVREDSLAGLFGRVAGLLLAADLPTPTQFSAD